MYVGAVPGSGIVSTTSILNQDTNEAQCTVSSVLRTWQNFPSTSARIGLFDEKPMQIARYEQKRMAHKTVQGCAIRRAIPGTKNIPPHVDSK